MKKRFHSILASDYQVLSEANHRIALYMVQKAGVAATRVYFDLERRDNVFMQGSDSFLKLFRNGLASEEAVDAPDTYAISHTIPENTRIVYRNGNRRKAGNAVHISVTPVNTAEYFVNSFTAMNITTEEYLDINNPQNYHYNFTMPESDVMITASTQTYEVPLSDCYWGANQSGEVLSILSGNKSSVIPTQYTTIPFETVNNPAYLWIAFKNEDGINHQRASYGGDYYISDTFEDKGIRVVEGIEYKLWVHKWKTEIDYLNFISKTIPE